MRIVIATGQQRNIWPGFRRVTVRRLRDRRADIVPKTFIAILAALPNLSFRITDWVGVANIVLDILEGVIVKAFKAIDLEWNIFPMTVLSSIPA